MFSIFGRKKTESKEEDPSSEHKIVNNQLDEQEDRKYVTEILKSLVKNVSLKSDVLSGGISLPCQLYEPLSILQRQAEVLEYSSLLDMAADQCTDRLDRMAYIAAFAVSCHSATQRFHNNFNPLLGETYELVDEERGVKFFSEQVSHHPPISAFHAESEKWVVWQNSNPTTSFLGNSLDIMTNARTHIYFPATKDHFYYTNPKTRVHNILLGKMWIEHFGEISITNLKSGHTCSINFKKSSFFSGKVQYNVEGTIKNKSGRDVIALSGRWDTHLDGEWLSSTRDTNKGKSKRLWTVTENNMGLPRYGLTRFASSFNEMDDTLKQLIPPTDSRLRLDLRSLINQNVDRATELKRMMEDRQRQDRKEREENNEGWEPVWFQKIPDEEGGHIWVYCGDYWEQRKQKLSCIEEGTDHVHLLDGGSAKGAACNFRSYDVEDFQD